MNRLMDTDAACGPVVLDAWVRHAVRAVAVCMVVGFVGVLLVADRGRLVWYISDDAYYYFMVAYHAAAGVGMTADGLTVTTGVHPLYHLLMVVLHRVVGTDLADVASCDAFVRAVVVANAVCFVLAGVLLGVAGRCVGDSDTGWWSRWLWLTCGPALLMAMVGTEGALHACVAAGWLAVLAWWSRGAVVQQSWQWVVIASVAAVMLVLVRVELVLVLAGSMVWLWWTASGRSGATLVRLAIVCVAAGGAWGAWLAYCHAQTGLALSGSAVIKQLWRHARTGGVWSTELTLWASMYGMWLVRCLFKVGMLKFSLPQWRASGLAGGLSRVMQQRYQWLLLAWPVVLGAIYAARLVRINTWYYAGSLAALTLLSAILWRRWLAGVGPRWTYRFAPVAWLIVMVMLAEGVGFIVVKAGVGRSARQERGLAIGMWMRRHLPADAIVGDWDSGIRSFYSNRCVVNLDGLVNNEIIAVERGELTMPAYFRQRGITHIVYNEDDVRQFGTSWPGGHIEPITDTIWRVVWDDRTTPPL